MLPPIFDIFTNCHRAIRHLTPVLGLLLICLLGGACEKTEQELAAHDRQPKNDQKKEVDTKKTEAPIPVGLEAVTARLPHDPTAFTQGFQYWNGVFIESTGGYGTSSIRLVEPGNGHIRRQNKLSKRLFGEGCAWTPEGIVQLTWRNHIAFRYNSETLTLVASYQYPREGWGLIYNGEYLWASDGSHKLYRLDPESLQTNREIEVKTRDDRPISRLNEMAWVEGIILANIFQENFIVAIDPETGSVLRKWDLTAIIEEEAPQANKDVLNGIAYDSAANRLWITGKRWHHIYQVELPDWPLD